MAAIADTTFLHSHDEVPWREVPVGYSNLVKARVCNSSLETTTHFKGLFWKNRGDDVELVQCPFKFRPNVRMILTHPTWVSSADNRSDRHVNARKSYLQ